MKRIPKVDEKRVQGRAGSAVADLFRRDDFLKDGEAHASKHIGELVRSDRDETRLRDLLAEGASSPRGKELSAGYFDVLRCGVKKRAK